MVVRLNLKDFEGCLIEVEVAGLGMIYPAGV